MKKITKLFLTIASLGLMASCGGNTSTTSSSTPASSVAPTSSVAPASSTESSVAPASSSSEDPRKKWSGYDTEWLTEDFSTKTISYQFTGEWALAEYNFYFTFCINLYDDASLRVEQRNTRAQSSNYYYGYWAYNSSEECLDINLTKEANGEKTVAAKYAYNVYESETKGVFTSFSLDFAMVPGQYFRQTDVTQNTGDAIWATEDAFHTAVDVIALNNYYESEDGNAKVWVWSTGVALFRYYYTGYGAVSHLHGNTGIRQDDSGNYITTLTLGTNDAVDLVADDDGKVTFSFKYSLGGNDMTATVTTAEADETEAAEPYITEETCSSCNPQ